MFAPTYQESARGNSVASATSDTCRSHRDCASAAGSIVVYPCERSHTMQSRTHSTCCSMDSTTLENTAGDPGPVIMNMVWDPAAATPRYACAPVAHADRNGRPEAPRMSIANSAPVSASNPVANTSAPTSYGSVAVFT